MPTLTLIPVLFLFHRGILEQGDGRRLECEAGQLSEAFEMPFEMPVEFVNAMERLDAPQVKRGVELMGQCVQVRHVECLFRCCVILSSTAPTFFGEKLLAIGVGWRFQKYSKG